jgi:hypothetical protein
MCATMKMTGRLLLAMYWLSSRGLSPHLLRMVLDAAAEQLTADTGPRLKLGPTKRKALA